MVWSSLESQFVAVLELEGFETFYQRSDLQKKVFNLFFQSVHKRIYRSQGYPNPPEFHSGTGTFMCDDVGLHGYANLYEDQ